MSRSELRKCQGSIRTERARRGQGNASSKVKSVCSEPARRGENDIVIFIFVSLVSKKLIKNHIREKQYFYLMASVTKTIDLRSSLIEKLYWGIKRACQCFLRNSS